MRTCAFVFILITAVVTGGTAQWPSGVTSGARIQVRLPELQYQMAGPRGQLIRGRIANLTPDTLYLSVTDSVGPLAIPRQIIDRLQVSRGSPSRLASALRSGLFSAAGTALIAVGLNELRDEPGRTSAGTAALEGAGVGFAVGALLGAIFPVERWKRVHLQAATRD